VKMVFTTSGASVFNEVFVIAVYDVKEVISTNHSFLPDRGTPS